MSVTPFGNILYSESLYTFTLKKKEICNEANFGRSTLAQFGIKSISDMFVCRR